MFRRNIILFFEELRNFILDFNLVKSKNKLINKICVQICRLNSDSVISWATAFPLFIWAADFMLNNIFNYLIEDIEPERVQAWPSEIQRILRVFEIEESLKRSYKYYKFLKN
jgi:hypothetical protein